MKTYHLKTILFTIFGCDIANFIYIKLFFFPKLLKTSSFKALLQVQGIKLDAMYVDELSRVLLMSLHNTIFLVLGFHVFITFMALKKKNWAFKYYKGYTLSACILSFIEVILSVTSFSPWHLILLITAILYGFAYKNIKKIMEQ